MGGSPTDNNARLFREGQMKVLQPLIDKGDIKIVGDQWVKDWLPEEALKIINISLNEESLNRILENINIFRDSLIKENKKKKILN